MSAKTGRDIKDVKIFLLLLSVIFAAACENDEQRPSTEPAGADTTDVSDKDTAGTETREPLRYMPLGDS